MTVPEKYVQTVVDACRERLGDPAGWVPPDAYRRSLALCIIESVQAAGTRFANAGTVVDRYLAYRRSHDPEPMTDGARALLRTFEAVGGAEQWAGKVGHYKRRYCASTAPLRATEIERTAERLHALAIDSVTDLRHAAHDTAVRDDLRTAWDEAGGARDDTTWRHLLLLAGVAGEGTTRATETFVRSAVDDATDAPPASEVLAAAADRLGVSPAALEHAVRRWTCTREDHAVAAR